MAVIGVAMVVMLGTASPWNGEGTQAWTRQKTPVGAPGTAPRAGQKNATLEAAMSRYEDLAETALLKNGLKNERRNTMNRFIGKVAMVMLVVAILSGVMLSGASVVWAKEKASTLVKQVQGSWTLVSVYVEQDGKKTEPFGPQPKGIVTITPDGRFSFIQLNASLPKFAADNRMKGTAEENKAIVQGSLATYGTYKVVNEKEHAVQLHIEGSTFPNWDGQDQKRTWIVKGDELTIINPYASAGGTAYNVWKRVK